MSERADTRANHCAHRDGPVHVRRDVRPLVVAVPMTDRRTGHASAPYAGPELRNDEEQHARVGTMADASDSRTAWER